MKKVLNKALAFIMAAALCVGMCATAFAAVTNSFSDTGTITISGIEPGLTVNGYKIAEAQYDSATGQFTGYKMLYDAGGFTINSDGSYDKSTLTEANLAALYEEALKGGTHVAVTVDADGVATFNNMAVGSYLFVVQDNSTTKSEATVYGMIIGSVSYDVDEDGNLILDNGSVNVKGDYAWAKSTTPTITKEETGGSLDDYEHGGSADLGDTLEYHITIGPIPSYEGEYPEFEVIDKISSDLTITDEELEGLYIFVKDSDPVETLSSDLYTVTRTSDGFTVDFVVDGNYTLNAYAGKMLVIDFCADVTGAGSATADDDDHENYAELDFSTTSYVYGNVGKVDDQDYDYTFNAKIQNTDQDGEALQGAEFSLYTDEDCTVAYTQNGTAVTATSASDGYFEFTGLEEGTYYMKETKAPAGYALNTNIYKIEITATYYDGTNGPDTYKIGELMSYSITVTDITNNLEVGSAVVSDSTASIANVKTGELPSMGGTGITLCVIAGCVVIAAAVCGVVVYRRRNAG